MVAAGRSLRLPAQATVLWVLTALAVGVLAARFAMRALGVRPDISFPGFLYGVTAPLVEPFYRFFPVSPRFDYRAFEVASLAAAGVAVAFALGIYVLGMIMVGSRRSNG